MTDNEIIKALEHDAISEFDHWVIDLINRQKAEIERLKAFEKNVYETVKELRNKIKAEAVEEFAERLISVSHPYGDTQMVFELQIRNLVKEMVGEG